MPPPQLPRAATPSSRGARTPSRTTRAVEESRRMEVVDAAADERELRTLAMQMYRDDVRQQAVERGAREARERHLRNAIRQQHLREHQEEQRTELQRLMIERDVGTADRLAQAQSNRQDQLRRAAGRLRNRRKFFQHRQQESKRLMDEERTVTLGMLQDAVLKESAASESRDRSVKLLLQKESQAHRSPSPSPPPSPTNSSPSVARRHDSPSAARPRPGHSTVSRLEPVTGGSTGLPPRSATPGANSNAPASALQPGDRHPKSKTPAPDPSARRHRKLVHDQARQFIGTALAKEAAAEQARYREVQRRAATPASWASPPHPLGSHSRQPVGSIAGDRSPPMSRPGTVMSDQQQQQQALLATSQSVEARREARAWRRLFGRFEDALGVYDAPPTSEECQAAVAMNHRHRGVPPTRQGQRPRPAPASHEHQQNAAASHHQDDHQHPAAQRVARPKAASPHGRQRPAQPQDDAGGDAAAGDDATPSTVDPVMANESRPPTRNSHTKRGGASDGAAPVPTPANAVTTEEFFAADSRFEALEDDDAPSRSTADDGEDGLGPARPPPDEDSDDDDDDDDGSSSITTTGDGEVEEDDGFADDDSEISDEQLRRVVDGSTTSSSESFRRSEIADETVATSAGSPSGEYPSSRTPPVPQPAPEAAPAMPPTVYGAAMNVVARVLQRWARGVALPVSRRRYMVRLSKERARAAALEDALVIVRKEHAAGDIQRAWRTKRRAATATTNTTRRV